MFNVTITTANGLKIQKDLQCKELAVNLILSRVSLVTHDNKQIIAAYEQKIYSEWANGHKGSITIGKITPYTWEIVPC